jgi:S-methylmethionine-dependent homocysteine/selenocysteine methylase
VPVTLLDGPIGTQLIERSIPAPTPLWSAWALEHRPDAVAALHREYAAAGATVHTANTFRTKRRSMGPRWQTAARVAVRLARDHVPRHHRVAGSIAPLEDCYHPEHSPSDPRPEHRELAQLLAAEGVDLLLCETFPHPAEAVVAVEEAVATGVETWVAFTAGYAADLLTPQAMAAAARRSVERGARACLVNCVPATESLRYLEALSELEVPVGVYANAGPVESGLGWGQGGAERYAELAATWVAAGATIIGSCCGTGPEHIRALAARFG